MKPGHWREKNGFKIMEGKTRPGWLVMRRKRRLTWILGDPRVIENNKMCFLIPTSKN